MVTKLQAQQRKLIQERLEAHGEIKEKSPLVKAIEREHHEHIEVLIHQGTCREVARRLGVSSSAVGDWRVKYGRRKGES